MYNNILVIGRGNSIKNIKKLKNNFDLVIIVNNFENEIKDVELSYFLKSSNLLKQYTGRDYQSLMKKETYLNLNVNSVVLNVLKDEFYGVGQYKQPSNNKKILDASGIPCFHLKDNILEYSLDKDNKSNLRQPSFPTTGILAFVDACINYNPKNITTIGIDFYKTDYFAHHVITKSKKPSENQVKKGLKMKTFLDNFIEKYCKPNNINVKIINE